MIFGLKPGGMDVGYGLKIGGAKCCLVGSGEQADLPLGFGEFRSWGEMRVGFLFGCNLQVLSHALNSQLIGLVLYIYS